MSDRTVGSMLGVAMVVACGAWTSLTSAAVVKFENPPPGQPGYFSWIDPKDPDFGDHFLDITRPSTDQPRVIGTTVFEYDYCGDCPGNSLGGISAPTGGGVLRPSDSELIRIIDDGIEHTTWYFNVPCGSSISDAVGTFSPGEYFTQNSDGKFFYSGVPGNAQSYVGVRFQLSGELHYGWFLVEKEAEFYDTEVEVLAWAYETAPNTPIIAGAPDPCCEGDLVTSAGVDVFDLFALLSAWGTDGTGADLAEAGRCGGRV